MADCTCQQADNCTSAVFDMIKNIQRQAAVAITGAYTNTLHIQCTSSLEIMAFIFNSQKNLKAFIPSRIRLWNNLDNIIRDCTDFDAFRTAKASQHLPQAPYGGFTKDFIHVSRLRIRLSGLNSHCKQYHFINNGTCPKPHMKKEDNVLY